MSFQCSRRCLSDDLVNMERPARNGSCKPLSHVKSPSFSNTRIWQVCDRG